jgi:hypothetical protein
MPNTDEENLILLQTARDNIIVLIGSVTSQPKPNYDIDGQKIAWADYLKSLRDALKDLENMITQAEGPAQEESQGYC